MEYLFVNRITTNGMSLPSPKATNLFFKWCVILQCPSTKFIYLHFWARAIKLFNES